MGRERGETDLVAAEARVALDTANQFPVAMDFRKRLLPGLPMQVVDVLRQQKAQHAHRLEFGQSDMAGIRLGRAQRPPQLVVLPPDSLLPRLFRILEKN